MKIYIFDIDGTLTSTNPELIKAAGYPTHAYWDLLTFRFSENAEALKTELYAWNQTVVNLRNEAFIASSADMMQRALLQTLNGLSEQEIVDYAKKVTTDFIAHQVVISEAIAFLNCKAEEGNLCILSTGSYQSGAVGFLKALSEAGLVSSTALDHIMVSGAVVDWKTKQLKHANVHNNKVKGVNELLQARCGFSLSSDSPHEVYVYADDPEGNDFGILHLTTPDKRYVIAHHKNSTINGSLEYSRVTWGKIVEKENLNKSTNSYR